MQELYDAVKALESANATLAAAQAAVDTAKADLLRLIEAGGVSKRFVFLAGDAAWFLDPSPTELGKWTITRDVPPTVASVDAK